MVAALIFLNNKLAFLALPIVQVILEELQLFVITLTFVDSQEAFPAELSLAFITDHHLSRGSLDDSFAIFARA